MQNSNSNSNSNKSSPLVVLLMVKNEANVIISTLKPLIDGGIKKIIIYDTGSTDGTYAIAEEYLETTGITYHIIFGEFINYSTSRNILLDYGDKIFEGTRYQFMLDADMTIIGIHDLLKICEEDTIDSSYDVYNINMFTKRDNYMHTTPRLIKSRTNTRYDTESVHENISKNAGKVPNNIFIIYDPPEENIKKSETRYSSDYDKLMNDYVRDPKNARVIFYLGQTCQFLGRKLEAIKYYKLRTEIEDFESYETYMSHYRIGYLIDYLVDSGDTTFSWNDALNYYLNAHQILPIRAEPLFRIACRYIRVKQYNNAYLFATRACKLQIPEDAFFCELQVYNYTRYDILSQCAIHVGEYVEGLDATLKALKQDPTNSNILHNLNEYLKFTN